jgi:hypothetical protein
VHPVVSTNVPLSVGSVTQAQKRAYVLADNQLAITGSGWDPELLRLELGELKLTGFVRPMTLTLVSVFLGIVALAFTVVAFQLVQFGISVPGL